jgi:hypothetical protein
MTCAHTGARERAQAMQPDAGAHQDRGAEVEIRVRGAVPAARVSALGLRASVPPRHTVLRGTLPDRPALHGALERLRGCGLEIVDVRPLPPTRR